MIVVGIENDKIALFAYFDASNPVGSLLHTPIFFITLLPKTI